MSLYARVLDGAPVEYRDLSEAPAILQPYQGVWLPVVDAADPDFDPFTQVLGEPVPTVGEDAVTMTRPVIARPLPSEVPMWRVRVILAEDGLLPDVDAAVGGLPLPIQERWKSAPNFVRNSPLVLTMIEGLGPTLGLDGDAVDAILRRAYALVE